MSMIERYKKKGGFVQLLNLIETTGKEKQDKFMKLIAEEAPNWEAEVRKKMLSLDKIATWNESYLAEIFPRIPAVQMAMLIGGLPEDKAQLFLKVLNFKERKAVDEILEDKKPTPAETSAGIMKLFAEIRKMVQEGSLKFEKFDESMVIPDDIEEKLASGKTVMTHKEFQSIPVDAPPAGTPANVAEEMMQLRRKLVQMTQETVRLNQENTVLRDKLEQIKKIA